MKVFEINSGIGMGQMALKQLGVSYESIGRVEADPLRNEVYHQLHGEGRVYPSLAEANEHLEPRSGIDVCFYSFPYRNLTTMKQSDFFEAFHAFLQAQQPKVLIWETNKNVCNQRLTPYFQAWLEALSAHHYRHFYQVMNTKHYGIPQDREQLLLISVLDPSIEFLFPEKSKTSLHLSSLLEASPSPELNGYKKASLFPIEKPHKNKPYPVGVIISDALKQKKTQQHLIYSPIGLSPMISSTDDRHPIKILTLPPIQTVETSTGQYSTPDRVRQSTVYRILSPLEYWRLMGYSDSDYQRLEPLNLTDKTLYRLISTSDSLTLLNVCLSALLDASSSVFS